MKQASLWETENCIISLINNAVSIALDKLDSRYYFSLHENICCGYSLEVPRRGTSNEYPQHMFLCRNKKNSHTFWLKKILSGTTQQVHLLRDLLFAKYSLQPIYLDSYPSTNTLDPDENAPKKGILIRVYTAIQQVIFQTF